MWQQARKKDEEIECLMPQAKLHPKASRWGNWVFDARGKIAPKSPGWGNRVFDATGKIAPKSLQMRKLGVWCQRQNCTQKPRIRKSGVWCHRQKCTQRPPRVWDHLPLYIYSGRQLPRPCFSKCPFWLILKLISRKYGGFYQFRRAKWREIHEIFAIPASE